MERLEISVSEEWVEEGNWRGWRWWYEAEVPDEDLAEWSDSILLRLQPHSNFHYNNKLEK